MSSLSVFLFGAPRIERDGAAVAVERRKSLALLAYLAVTRQPHGRDALAALLWPELDETHGRGQLRSALVDLQHALGQEWVEREGERVALPGGPGLSLDVGRFHELLAQVTGHSHPPFRVCDACLAALTETVNLYSSDFLAGFTLEGAGEFDAWQTFQTESLRLELAGALEKLAAGLAGWQDYDPAIARARRWLALDSLHEPAHRLLMQLYVWAGDRAAAIRQYQECVKVLREELGIEPEPETSALFEAIRGGAAAEPSPALPCSLSPTPMHNLPPDPTPFIGRSAELAQIAARLADPACRLLTVLGSGGVGKTRLAIQAAREHQARFRDGVCFVDLAPVGTADLLASTILRALAAPSEGAVAEDDRLLAYLADKQALLVLDNFEHLLDGVALLPEILRRAPDVALLVTSRERLNVREEWLEPLEGLEAPGDLEHEATKEPRGGAGEAREARRTRSEAPVPSRASRFVDSASLRDFVVQPATLERYSATALFLACVRRLRPDFAPADDDARHIARICRLLEGMPLGIELAAAWAGKLPLAEIADELAESLDLLTTTLRDVPPRHRSMRAAFDRSWRLLSARERGILRQLSVFRGGFTRAAGEAVAGATLADLSALVDSSWLRAEPSGRYAMHELIRQYCGERLAAEHAVEAGETADQVRARHAAYHAQCLGAQEPQMNWRPGVMAELGPETGNLDAAWRWVIGNGDYEMGRVLVMGHYFKAEMEGRYYATVQLLGDAAESLRRRPVGDASRLPRQESGLLLGWVLFVQGALYWHLGRLARGRTCIDEGLAILRGLDSDDRQVELYWLTRDLASRVIEWQGDFEGAARFLQEWLVHLQTRGGRCWPYLPEVGTRFIEANAYTSLGRTLWRMGSYEEAQHLLRRSLELREALGEQRSRAHGLTLMSCVLRTVGEYDEAERQARAGLALSEAQGDRIGTALGLNALGGALMAADRHVEADAHFEGGLAIARESGKHDLLTGILSRQGGLALARSDLGLAGRLYQQSRASFERLGIVGTSGYAETVIGLGDVALAGGDLIGAQVHFREALAARACTAWEKMDAIAGTAQVFAGEGDTAQAAELLALVSAHPFTAHATRERVRARLAELEAELPADVFATAVARGRSRPLDDVVAEQLGAAQEDPRAFA